MELKGLHLKFCLEYLKHFNGAKAARDAGYKKTNADRVAYAILQRPDVQAFLADKRKQIEAEADIEIMEIIRHLKAMAFFDIRDIIGDNGDLKPIDQWPDIACKVVSGIDIETRMLDDDVATIKKVKIPSREKNTENLGRYVGMFTDNMKVDTGDGKKYVYVFPGFKPGMPVPVEESEDGDNGRYDGGNGRDHSDGGGNGRHNPS